VPQSNTIAPFLIRPDGTLKLAPGGSVGAPVDPPLVLGTASHPTLNIVYAGLTGASQVGVFTYDETGRISFVDSVPDAGAAGCWCVVSADGKFLYVATTGSDSVGVFSLDDPLNPVQIQELSLRHVAGDLNQTADFQIGLDPSGQSLYVVNQSVSPTGTAHRGNQLHILSVAGDGTLSEQQDPLIFSPADVPANAHPQGVAFARTADDSGPAAGDNPGLGGALFAFVRNQGRSGQPAPAALLFALDSSGQLPFVGSRTAAATDAALQSADTVGGAARAGRGDGQRLDLSKLDAAQLDALFGSDVLGQDGVSDLLVQAGR
jgi:hypothetical protein